MLTTRWFATWPSFRAHTWDQLTGYRDHWPQCWTVYFAGGGVKGGRVVGKSDDIGAYSVERPVNPSEIVATIYHSLGLDLEAHLPGPQSRPHAGGLRDAAGQGIV